MIPAMRTTPADGEEQVLIGVTDRRVVLVGRRRPLRGDADAGGRRHRSAPRRRRAASSVVPHVDGHLEFDLDEDAIARMWAHIDDIDRQPGRRRTFARRDSRAARSAAAQPRRTQPRSLSRGGCAGSP